jgi:hypothetical protein
MCEVTLFPIAMQNTSTISLVFLSLYCIFLFIYGGGVIFIHLHSNLYRLKQERGEGGSEEQSSVAVCGGCPMLQIGVTGSTD